MPPLISFCEGRDMFFIENLESRQMLSAVNISHGAIIVTGSNGNDSLTISLTPGNKKIAINYWEVAHMQNPIFKVIKAKGIKKIQVNMRGGDDSAGVGVGKLPIRINIKGGPGNDEIGADVKRGAVSMAATAMMLSTAAAATIVSLAEPATTIWAAARAMTSFSEALATITSRARPAMICLMARTAPGTRSRAMRATTLPGPTMAMAWITAARGCSLRPISCGFTALRT
jgi:hypothetical protein